MALKTLPPLGPNRDIIHQVKERARESAMRDQPNLFFISGPSWVSQPGLISQKKSNFPLLVQSVYLHPSKTQQHVISLWRQMDSFSSTTFMSFHSSAQKSESEAILKMQPVWSRAQIRQWRRGIKYFCDKWTLVFPPPASRGVTFHSTHLIAISRPLFLF